MRVGMNVEQLVQDGVSGIATYTAELVRALPHHGWDVTPFTARHSHAHVDAAMRAAGLGDAAPVVLPLPRPALYDAWHAGLADPIRRIAPVDLVHAPSVAVPPVSDVPLVVTAHDAAPVTFPATYPRRGRRFHRQGFAAAARRARLVIAVSAFSADELAANTPVARERIRVVPNGVVVEPVTAADVVRAKERIGIGDRPYVLWVGTVQPRKNVRVLVEAFRGAVASGVPHALVLVGAQGWVDAGVGARDGDEAWLVMPGATGAHELAALYDGADVFALPSLHEGFGLPALEAMGQGTAALLSDIPALREAAGDAARYVPPTDVGAWRDAVVELLGDAAARDAMAAPGRARAAALSWERCATATVAVYEEALA